MQYHHYSVLKLALKDAVSVGTLLDNPAASVSPPTPEPDAPAVLTEQELGVLFKATAGSRIYVLVLLAATTGMRRGELLGLRWKHVSLDGANIQVVASLEQTAGGLRFKQLKTKAGRRTISLPSIAVDILRLHKISQAEERLKMGSGYDNQDFVFATIEGHPLSPRNVTKQYSRIVAGTDIPRISFHGLRHTPMSLLLKAGVHPKVASERAGHSSVAITLDIYSHVLPGLQEDAAMKVNEVVRTALDGD